MQQQVNEIFVFFTSKYSNACKQVVEKINYIAPHFNTRIVDIDNPDTRFVLQNATQYKIETVPSALIIYPTMNKINKLESMELLQLLDKGIEMVNQKLAAIQEEQNRQKASRRKVVEIDGEDDEEVAYDNKTDIRQALQIEDDEDEEEPPRRRKIGKTHIFPDKRFAPVDEDDMITTSKPLPPIKGEGHDGMAQSSLVEAPRGDKFDLGMDRNMNYPPRMKQSGMEEEEMIEDMAQMQQMKKGKKKKKIVTFDDSLLDVSEPMGNDNDGMSMDDILGQNGGNGRSREIQERSSSLKQNAAALAAAREQIMKQEDGNTKVRVMP